MSDQQGSVDEHTIKPGFTVCGRNDDNQFATVIEVYDDRIIIEARPTGEHSQQYGIPVGEIESVDPINRAVHLYLTVQGVKAAEDYEMGH